MRGPSAHLFWSELACHDGTEYPQEWRLDRAVTLACTFEDIRNMLGDQPLVILSGYRTPAYNATIEGAAAKSQHCEGRAVDIWHPSMEPDAVFSRIRRARLTGLLPLLGGIGIYRTFVHIDVRLQNPRGHLAVWSGKGAVVPGP